MRIFGANDNFPLPGLRPVVTLGVFDGVHLGHLVIIEDLMATARKIGAPALVVTFNPHPRQALGRSAPSGICSLEGRLRRLSETGLDATWVLPFTRELSRVSGREFVEEYFHRRLAAGVVVLGQAAVFGRDREGNVGNLAEWVEGLGIQVRVISPFVVKGTVVSSTAVRLAVQSGELDKATSLLGRRPSIEGTVVRGQGNGRHLGFPTLNVDPHHELRPPPGVYLTRTVIDGAWFASVTNIGRPPTEAEIGAGLADFLIETHLLDYSGDLYARTVEVFFYRKLREVMRFSRSSGLVRQVSQDLNAARQWFADHPEN